MYVCMLCVTNSLYIVYPFDSKLGLTGLLSRILNNGSKGLGRK